MQQNSISFKRYKNSKFNVVDVLTVLVLNDSTVTNQPEMSQKLCQNLIPNNLKIVNTTGVHKFFLTYLFRCRR